MGRKVHPIGFRLGYIKDWQSKWFAERNYTDQLHEDIALRGRSPQSWRTPVWRGLRSSARRTRSR